MKNTGKLLVSSYNETVLSSSAIFSLDCDNLVPCNHEEADTRIFLHVKHTASQFSKVLIKSVDTDVVVLAISLFDKLNVSELWIQFGVEKSLKNIPVHEVALSIGSPQCHALPFFTAVTGCATTSSFNGKGKKSEHAAWMVLPEVTEAFNSLGSLPECVSLSDSRNIERFVVATYSRICPADTVNEARKFLFSQGDRMIENIPPTENALKQHIKRAVYQAGYVWYQSLQKVQSLPCPSEWGWKSEDGNWTPLWTTIPQASKVCQELIRCGCLKSCGTRCKCNNAKIDCTALCKCSGTCSR